MTNGSKRPDRGSGEAANVSQRRRTGLAVKACALGSVLLAVAAGPGRAQQSQSSFGLDILRGAISEEALRGKPGPNTTVLPRNSADPGTERETGQITLVALMTEDGQRIQNGIVWRIYAAKGADGKPRLVATHAVASPAVRLAAGSYFVNAAFGRANLTRKLDIDAGSNATEQFALNVGLLRVKTMTGKKRPLAPGATQIDVFADERDKFGEPKRVISGAKADVLLRLNSGLYHVVSRLGDANATVQADITVEPGKLTEATVIHNAARISFKLVTRPGGEATPQTQWSIVDREGDIVKESAGALPSHTLAPGTYTVTARTQGRAFRRLFTVRSGEAAQIEVLMN